MPITGLEWIQCDPRGVINVNRCGSAADVRDRLLGTRFVALLDSSRLADAAVSLVGFFAVYFHFRELHVSGRRLILATLALTSFYLPRLVVE